LVSRPAPAQIPSVEILDRLDEAAFVNAVAPIYEGAPAFLALLAKARPFGSDAAMLAAAREIARTMPEAAQIELLAAHPRIGADPTAVSPLSSAEQGHADPDAEPLPSWVDQELAMHNDAYEARFGFRFVVFVAGRDRAEIIPLIEKALRSDDRAAELRRGTDDVVDIAADRLAKLRA
jgi:2-oxo-4-hydroxy-4-carboxy--5-ureidoimidazoline (OHCU) decarboxylase